MSDPESPGVPITIAIMAGGASRRMGRDKASIVIDGIPLLERIALEAAVTGLPVIIIGRTRPADWSGAELDFIPDDAPSLGPLGGLATALRHRPFSVLAIACDMPLLMRDAIGWLIDRNETGDDLEGTVSTCGGEIEPLFSIYHQSSLARIEQRLTADERSMKGLIEEGSFRRIEAPAWVARQLMNVNRPEDLPGGGAEVGARLQRANR